MKNKVKVITLSCATSFLLTPIICGSIEVKADQTSSEVAYQAPHKSIDDKLASIATPYVLYDKINKKFIVSDDIKYALSASDIEAVQEQVSYTNNQIVSSINEVNMNQQVNVVDSNNNETYTVKPAMTRSYGVNSVSIHWNYAKVKINAGTLYYAVQSGFAIGSVYAPAKIVQAACAVAGVVGPHYRNGIWIDLNYYSGFLIKAGIQ